GCHPDPSLCRVGNEFWLVTSSFAYAPGLPLFRSRDLVYWQPVGHVLDRPGQLDLSACGASSGVFAPTIRHHAGRWFVVTTIVGGAGNILLWTDDPARGWSDPLPIDTAWFDPDLLFLDDGSCWYSRKDDSGIVTAPLDPRTGRLLDRPRTIARPEVTSDFEGPHRYRIGDWWYLLVAEGGTRSMHAAVMLRSREPFGPYERDPAGPLATHRHLGHGPIRDIGHADLVEAADGSWWLCCLGTRQVRYDAASVLGRETFLAPVRWVDGWPRLVHDRIRPDIADRLLPAAPWPEAPVSAGPLAPGWQTVRWPAPGAVAMRGDTLDLTCLMDHPEDPLGAPAMAVTPQTGFTGAVAADLIPPPGGEAGLILIGSDEQQVRLAVRDGHARWQARIAADIRLAGDPLPIPPGPVRLRIVVAEGRCHGEVLTGGGTWIRIGGLEERFLAPELASRWAWTGVMAGAWACGRDGGLGTVARFRNLDSRWR
ncbi:MAG: Beta-xylosidase, partial [Planctomycetota bacterium]